MKVATSQAQVQPEVVRRGELGLDHFLDSPVARWRPEGIREVPLTVPREISQLAAETAPPSGWLGADALMVPARWHEKAPPVELPDLWCLQGARVYGGANVDRTYQALPLGAEGWHWDGQLVLTSDYELIPASHGVIDGNRTLPRDLLTDVGDGLDLAEPSAPRHLSGTYVLLGNLQPHFGHFVLEGLSRAWAIDYLDPDLDAQWLIYEPRLSRFGARLLSLAGIRSDRVVHASPCDIVERLVVPDQAMRSHRWITSAQAASWERISRTSEPRDRVYLSRAGVSNRGCVNEDEVERIFARAGWAIVRPETLRLRKQVELAGRARRLAGVSGSQMYLTAFQPRGGDDIVVAPRNFVLRDDLLIAAAQGHHLRMAIGGMVDFSSADRSWAADLDRVSALV